MIPSRMIEKGTEDIDKPSLKGLSGLLEEARMHTKVDKKVVYCSRGHGRTIFLVCADEPGVDWSYVNWMYGAQYPKVLKTIDEGCHRCTSPVYGTIRTYEELQNRLSGEF